jgi:hypothetical protein
MKKVLIGCLFAGGLLGLVVAGLGAWMVHVAGKVMGDLKAGIEVVTTMPVDRMEQEATDVPSAEFAARVTGLLAKPVRLTGTVATWPEGTLPPGTFQGTDPHAVLFLEPATVVLGYNIVFPPAIFPRGTQVELVGIASRLNLREIPGLDAAGRERLTRIFGSAEYAPILVAARGLALARPPPDPAEPSARPVPSWRPDAGQ